MLLMEVFQINGGLGNVTLDSRIREMTFKALKDEESAIPKSRREGSVDEITSIEHESLGRLWNT